MSSDRLLSWFEKRRKTRILGLAQRQILLAIDTVNALERTLKAFSEGKKSEVETYIKQLFEEEDEIDDLRRTVLEELTKGKLPPRYREDLHGLVRRLDHLADRVKDSARSIQLLIGTSSPKKIKDELVDMSEDLKVSATTLGQCISTLGTNPEKSIELAKKVDFYEGKIDERHLKVKFLLLENSKELGIAVFTFLKDLTEHIEEASDVCVSTADYIRTLAASEITEKTH